MGYLDDLAQYLGNPLAGEKPANPAQSPAPLATYADDAGQLTKDLSARAASGAAMPDPIIARTAAVGGSGPASVGGASDGTYTGAGGTTAGHGATGSWSDPQVSVGMAKPQADADFVKSYQSLAGQGAIPGAPAGDAVATNTVAEDPLLAAQRLAAKRQDQANSAAAYHQAANMMTGFKQDEGSDLFKRQEEMAGRPTKDLLAQRQAQRDAVKDKGDLSDVTDKIASRDINSPGSKRATALARRIGAIGPNESMTEAKWEAYKEAGGILDTQAKTKEAARREDKNAAEAERYHKDEIALGYAKIRAELAREKGVKVKDIPQSEVDKNVNESQALAAIDASEKAQKAVGPIEGAFGKIGIHTGDDLKYQNTLKALAAPTALGVNPEARGSAPMMDKFVDDAPSGAQTAAQAKQYFDKQREAVRASQAGRLSALQAGGYSPEQVANLRAQAAANGGHGAAQFKPHHADAKAVEWAKAHPGDPDAAKILAANGG